MGICSAKKYGRQEYQYLPHQIKNMEQQNISECQIEQQQQQQLPSNIPIEHISTIPTIQSNLNKFHLQKEQNIKIQKDLSARQLQIDQVCAVCNKHVNQQKTIQIKKCKHIYDIHCFTNHFQENKKCCSDEKIIINETEYPKAQVNEIMKYQLNQLITKIQDKMIVVQCQTQFCSFLFFYLKVQNLQQSKKFYCIRCNQTMKYDKKMCKFIDQQTAFKNQNQNDAQVYNKLEFESYECQIEDHLIKTNILIILPCSHQWCKICLFLYYKDCLKAICYCGERYPTSIVKQINQENEWDDIYEKQLDIIQKEAKISWQFCKNNCGFFSEIKNLDDSFYCIKCDPIKICQKCQQDVQSQYVTMNQCQHYYHLLCSLELLMENQLSNMKCLCGVKLDEDTKKNEMNIICFYCQKYDDDLIMLQCCHFIHKECLEANLEFFSSFLCPLCDIPLGNILFEPKLQLIGQKLIDMHQNQKEDKLNNYQCKHCSYHFKMDNNCYFQMHLQGNQQIKYDDKKVINNDNSYK
ncbi:unnamed protein product [Paramecium pentaurelia]|uniref:RING-type domain-containing protein n=1 Tax=Paramecium pentaurelia TaxID=43138 RepID=A0A8S1RYA8_9CILI|nr:unnamed protein product [Paramecium pentaurelia]